MSKLRYDIKQKIIEIAGTCFWINRNFYDFLESCGVKREHYKKYDSETGKFNKMRSILTDLEDSGQDEVLKNIQSGIYKLKTVPDKQVPDIKLAEKSLQEFRILCGKDIIENEIESEAIKKELMETLDKSNEYAVFLKKLDTLKERYIALMSKVDVQGRGFELEQLLNELFVLNEIEFNKSYKSGNEQIDGFFYFDRFHYLLEIKWIKDGVKQGDLAVLDKKVDKKLQSSRGFFIAINGFDDEAIEAFSNHRPRLILMDGEDLFLILDNKVTMADAIKAKVDDAVKNGNIFFKIKNILC